MLRQNTLANFAGQAFVGILTVAFIPLYVHLLGIKAYGLVGVFAILQSAMGVLDLGMSPALNREIARHSAGILEGQLLRDLLRSLESIYFALGIVILSCFWLLAPWLASHWFAQSGVSRGTIVNALNLMAVVVVLRSWELAYRSSIQGMQKQVWLNVAQSGLAVLRWVGVLGVLIWVSPTIEAFFIWQGIVSVLTFTLLAFKTYSHMPATARGGRFSIDALRQVWRFTSGLALASVVALVLTQADKVLLSKWSSLGVFGLYTLAASLSNLLPLVIYPINNAVYPKLSEQIAGGDTLGMAETYFRASQWLSVFLVPPAILLAIFAKPAVYLWTGDPVLTAGVVPILRLLVIGNMFYGFATMPHLLQLSLGWIRLTVAIYVVALFLYLPILAFAVHTWGALGAAGGFLALNVGFAGASIYLTHQKLLPQVRWPWLRDVILLPVLFVIVTGVAAAVLLPQGAGKIVTAGWLILSGMLAVLAAAWSAPAPRAFLRDRWRLMACSGRDDPRAVP